MSQVKLRMSNYIYHSKHLQEKLSQVEQKVYASKRTTKKKKENIETNSSKLSKRKRTNFSELLQSINFNNVEFFFMEMIGEPTSA